MSGPSHIADVNPVIDAIAGRTFPAQANMISMGLIGLGVVGLVIGFAMAGVPWTLGAILVSLVWILAVSVGGVMFGVVLTGTWGRWGRPVKRIGEAFTFFLPVAYAILVVFCAVGWLMYPFVEGNLVQTPPIDLAPHSPAAHATKEFWLQWWFIAVRQLGLFAVLMGLIYVYVKASLRPDMIQAAARLGDKTPAWWSRFTAGAGSLEAEVEKGHNTQSLFMVFITLAYVTTFTLLSTDLIMSLSPHWYTNMFGGWFFVSSFWVALAAIGFTAMLTRDWLNLGKHVLPYVTHDIGKLMLAGCMFWAYTAFAQLLPIWYTNLPEETDFLLVRITLPEWAWLSQLVAITCFIAPFTILLSRGIKKLRWPFAAICLLVMVGIWLERTLLVMPSVWTADYFPWLNFLLVSIPIQLGMIGLFIQVVGRVLATLPPLVTSDPYLQPHPWDTHVHSLDHAHH